MTTIKGPQFVLAKDGQINIAFQSYWKQNVMDHLLPRASPGWAYIVRLIFSSRNKSFTRPYRQWRRAIVQQIIHAITRRQTVTHIQSPYSLPHPDTFVPTTDKLRDFRDPWTSSEPMNRKQIKVDTHGNDANRRWQKIANQLPPPPLSSQTKDVDFRWDPLSRYLLTHVPFRSWVHPEWIMELTQLLAEFVLPSIQLLAFGTKFGPSDLGWRQTVPLLLKEQEPLPTAVVVVAINSWHLCQTHDLLENRAWLQPNSTEHECQCNWCGHTHTRLRRSNYQSNFAECHNWLIQYTFPDHDAFNQRMTELHFQKGSEPDIVLREPDTDMLLTAGCKAQEWEVDINVGVQDNEDLPCYRTAARFSICLDPPVSKSRLPPPLVFNESLAPTESTDSETEDDTNRPQ